MKARELLVRHAAPGTKTIYDAVLDAAEPADVLREHGHVVRTGCARERGGVLGGQTKALGRRIELDHAGGHHRAEPLADVACIQAGFRGDTLGAGRRQAAERVEEPRTVADRDHQAQRAVVERCQKPAGECLGASVIEVELSSRLCHGYLLASLIGCRLGMRPTAGSLVLPSSVG